MARGQLAHRVLLHTLTRRGGLQLRLVASRSAVQDGDGQQVDSGRRLHGLLQEFNM